MQAHYLFIPVLLVVVQLLQLKRIYRARSTRMTYPLGGANSFDMAAVIYCFWNKVAYIQYSSIQYISCQAPPPDCIVQHRGHDLQE